MNYPIRITGILLLISLNFPAFAQYATSITVALDGSGDYTSIQTALNNTKSFPDLPITIYLKKGIYHEKVRVYPWNTNLTIIGEDSDSTVITYDDYFDKINRGRNSTFHTATLSVEATDFKAKDLTIINAAGPVGQAIALSVSGDRCVFEHCSILGHQDTLYCTGESSRQYFVDCHIEGTTDFIFGNATAVFEGCTIRSLADSFITAASTTPNQRYGLVFLHCRLTASTEVSKVYLGRPWRAFAKTVYVACEYGPHILPEGWDDWGQESNHSTAYYAEYSPGGNLEERVPWSKKLGKKALKTYRLEKILHGWKP